METENINRGTTKQLTPTEIGIAVAEICDRFMRYISASWGCHHADPINEESEMREKYDIPEGVTLLSECALVPNGIALRHYTPLIRDWVNGKLTEEEAKYFIWYLQEVDEMDYGWVFMEEPMWFYGGEGIEADISSIDKKFIAIGTRAPNKRIGKPIKQILPFP